MEETVNEDLLTVGPLVPNGRGRAYWDRDSVIDAIQRWAARHDGRPPTARNWRRSGPDWPCTATVQGLFGGSFTRGIRAAGFDQPYRRSSPKLYSDEEIFTAIRQALAEGDDSSAFQTGRRRPWMKVITDRFDTWNKAVALAGASEQQTKYRLETWDEDYLRREYVDRNRTMAEIAADLGCDRRTVLDGLRRFGIKARPAGRRPKPPYAV